MVISNTSAHAALKQQLAHYNYVPAELRSRLDAHLATCAECAGELSAGQSPAPAAPDSHDRTLGRNVEQSASLVRGEPAASLAALARTSPALSRRGPAPDRSPPAEVGAPPPARGPARAARLFIPAVFAAVFLFSLWFGMRDTDRPPIPPPTQTVAAVGRMTPQPSATPQPARTTIVFACDDVAAVYRDYAEIAADFEKANPDITVELKSYRDLVSNVGETLSYVQLIEEIAAYADAFCVWNVAPLVEAHLLYNLDPLVARDSNFDVQDFYEAVLSTVRDTGTLYAVPSRFQPALIRYDPAAFQAAGIAPPRPGWTWDDFLTAAVALTQREGGNTRRWGFGEDAGLIFNARFRAALDDPAFVAAASAENPFLSSTVFDLFRWYERLYVDARAARTPRAHDWAGGAYEPVDVDPAQIGEVGMAMWTDLLYQNARRHGKPAPFPSGGLQAANMGVGPVYTHTAWAMAAETLHPDATWRWLNYLSRNPPPDVNQLRLPARRSLAEKASFWDALPPEEAGVYRYVLEHLQAPTAASPDPGVLALYKDLQWMVAGRLTLFDLLARRGADAGRSTAQPSDALTLRFAAPRADLPIYLDAARNFERERGIHVELLAREDLMDQSKPETTPLWSQMRQIAGRADVLAGPEVAALVRSGRSEGILCDLTSLAASLAREDFYPNMLESLQWRERTWAIPARVNPYLILYNQWMFDQLGLPYPQPGWTWEDFDRSAQAATSRGADQLIWSGFKDGPGNQLMLLEARLGPLLNYDGGSPAGIDASRAVEALRWYGALFQRGALRIPNPEQASPLGSVTAPQDAAMWISLTELSVLPELRKGQIGAVPFPSGKAADRPNHFEMMDAYAISTSSQQVDAAWRWIRHLLQRDPGAGTFRPGVSAQPALVDLAPGDPQSKAVYHLALGHARRLDPLRPEQYLVRHALRLAVVDVTSKREDPATALQQALQAAQSTLSR